MSPNAPARKLNFRPRPIDVFRKLDVIRSKKGLQLDDEVIVQRGVPAQPSGMDSDEEEEAHISAAVTSGSRAAVDIPTPTCAVVPTYALEKYVRFERPQSYVRARTAFEDTEVEYDMDGKDDDFLQKNFPNDKGLNDVKYELIMDRLEKERSSHRLS